MKTCVLENFLKFKISKANVDYRLQTRNQCVIKATDYITPVCSSTVLSSTSMGLTRIQKILKNREKQIKKNRHTTVNNFTITSLELRRTIVQ